MRLEQLRHRGRDGVRVLDRVLDGAGGHSRLERDFLRLLRDARLPRPAGQTIYRIGGRVVARTDFSFEPRRPVIVEVAGHATHATRRQRQRDAQRHAELQLLGLLVLTFTYEDVTERPGWVVDTVRRALQYPFEVPNSSTFDARGA
jgi:very-short-patch-repair endonuclease